MTYNEQLADRVREIIARTERDVKEKRMFGGLCFMVDDKMCVGVEADRMMLRIGPDVFEEALEKDGCTPMDFTGTVMKGYVFVDNDALATNKQLDYWMKLALDFNKVAKASKKKPAAAKKGAKAAPKKTAPKKGTSAKKTATAKKKVATKKTSPRKKTAPKKKTTPKKKASSAKTK